VVSPETLSAWVSGINVPTLLEKYREIYETQNVPDDNPVQKFAPVLLILVLLLIYANFHTLSLRFKTVLQIANDRFDYSSNSVGNVWFTGFFVLFVLLIKESTAPFYFTQDDNHSQFLPKLLVGLEMLFRGEMPFIDNYHHFGAQLFEIGTYAFFEPLMIISYAASKYILFNSYATLEVYAALSSFTGAIFLGYTFRALGIAPCLSFCAIVSIMLSGYFFISNRSWYYTAGISCYVPVLLFFLLQSLKGKFGWWWFLPAGISRGMFFYAGNAQFFIYAIALELVCYLYLSIKYAHRSHLLFQYFCSFILTTGIITPLFFSQFLLLKEIERTAEPIIAYNGMPIDALISSFYPYPFSWSVSQKGDTDKNLLIWSNMFHIGFAWMFPFIIGFIQFLRFNTGRYQPLLLLGVMLFFLSAGYVSLIYPLKYFLPVFNKMKVAHKFFPYATFAIVIYSTLVLNELGKSAACRKPVIIIAGLSVIVSLLTAIFGTNAAFFIYGEKPYPLLNPGISKHVNRDNDILFGLAPIRYGGTPYVTALQHNYGNLYSIKTANFYDPLLLTGITGYPARLDEYFKRYGITKAVLLKIPDREFIKLEYPQWQEAVSEIKRYPVIYEDDEIVLYGTYQPAWILRPLDNPEAHSAREILEYDRTKIRVKISSTVKSQWEYHNEYRSGYYVYVNGKRGEITKSPDGWCMLEVPEGEAEIEIRYMPPFFWKGIMVGIILSVFSVFAFHFLRKFAFKLHSENANSKQFHLFR